ncbi:alpha/beta-hydrolase [Trametes polyzona]|nr:alpha/beta-hydrolase [Trametes polyzona]
MDPSSYKTATVSRGFLYNYFYSPAAPGKPTLLFIHGFPSSSYDWRKQVAYFRPKGYGILAPDTLGAGGSAHTEDVHALRFAVMAKDIVELLDKEGVEKVIGIGHDWGSVILSRMANLHPERFHAFVWLAVSYLPPLWQQEDPGARAAVENIEGDSPVAVQTKEAGRFGYWELMVRNDAHLLLEAKLDSFLQLSFPTDPETWIKWQCPQDKTEEWLKMGRTPGFPAWLPQEEYDEMRRTLMKTGFKTSLKYYATLVTNANIPDEQVIPLEAYHIRQPVLFIAATRDYINPPAAGKAFLLKYVPHATIVEFSTGHSPHLEDTERFNMELEKWLKALRVVSM